MADPALGYLVSRHLALLSVSYALTRAYNIPLVPEKTRFSEDGCHYLRLLPRSGGYLAEETSLRIAVAIWCARNAVDAMDEVSGDGGGAAKE